MRILLLISLLSHLATSSPSANPHGGSWCPRGTWQDVNGDCHQGRPGGDAIPVGWVDYNGNQHIWANPNPNPNPNAPFPFGSGYRTYTLPDGTRVTVGDGRYSTRNNPAIFFDADFKDRRDIQPMRDLQGGVPYLRWINWNFARKMRIAHGVISSLAFLVLFPLGAIMVNLGPGICGVITHAGFQVLGWIFYLIGAAAGLWMASVIRWREFSFFTNYHVIIGLILFVLLLFQPLLGVLHHIHFRRHQRRGMISHLHIWLGRIIIITGMINGGLGLLIAGNASRGQIAAYITIAVLVFVAWIASSLIGALKRHRRDVPRRRKTRLRKPGDSPVMTGPARM